MASLSGNEFGKNSVSADHESGRGCTNTFATASAIRASVQYSWSARTHPAQ
jgi:hypothetical protein